ISPYRIPLFNCLHNQSSLELRVVALAEKEQNREWQIAKERIKFDCRILPGLHAFIWGKEMPIHLNRGLWRILRRYEPDVVITSGYDALAYWEALLYCKTRAKRFILWNGTTLLSTRETRGLIGAIKRTIIRKADGYVSYGTKAAEYLQHMGASRKKIQVGVNTVDMEWYRRQWQLVRDGRLSASARPNLPPVLLLYVGQLIERKNVKRLLEALARLRDPDVGVLIVGSGPLESELKEFCRRSKVKNVFFEGFKQQPELPRYYALADVLVLPSIKEVWGLVVNEALATGLYVLCSNCAGAAYDLIREGWNGRTFDPYDVDQLAALIRETKEHIGEIRARRDAISERACREFSIERSARAFLDAIRCVMNRQAQDC
ncbi:MAG: glycosyltransferase family 4 protein, partial [Anaerolineae bacterium]